jgi:hypothetical protein
MSSLSSWANRPEHRRGRDGAAPVLLAVMVLAAASACRSGAVVERAGNPSARGTIAGTVRGPEGVAPVEGRLVEAVEVQSGLRYGTTTNPAGGFSLMVPPGRYRLEVALTSAESIVKEPGVITVEPSGLADEKNVVLGGAGVVKEN